MFEILDVKEGGKELLEAIWYGRLGWIKIGILDSRDGCDYLRDSTIFYSLLYIVCCDTSWLCASNIFMEFLHLRVGGTNLLIHSQVDCYEAVVTDAGKQVVAVARQVEWSDFAL